MDTKRRASTVYRWAGMWYVGTLREGGGWLEDINPWHLQPRLLQHSHLGVCFSPLPSWVPRPSGPAEGGHRARGLLLAVFIGQASLGTYCA